MRVWKACGKQSAILLRWVARSAKRTKVWCFKSCTTTRHCNDVINCRIGANQLLIASTTDPAISSENLYADSLPFCIITSCSGVQSLSNWFPCFIDSKARFASWSLCWNATIKARQFGRHGESLFLHHWMNDWMNVIYSSQHGRGYFSWCNVMNGAWVLTSSEAAICIASIDSAPAINAPSA